MKQITEDYVSYEIAVLLKEKGFDEKCIGFYTCTEKPYFMEASYRNNWTYEKHGSINAPTHQMALKWLREVHNIYIDILTYTTGKDVKFRWVGYDKGRLFSQEEGKIIYFDTHKQTIEAALKYTLENLI